MTDIYREKPAVVEARVFDGSQTELMDVVNWVQQNGYTWFDMFTPAPSKGVSIQADTGFMVLANEGMTQAVQKGDYVLKSPGGRISAVRPDIFLATYEPVEEEDA